MRVLSLPFAASVALGLVLLGAVPAGAAAPGGYVALGDSYSAGVGAGSSSGSCERSPNAYPALWAAAHTPSSFSFVACSGATVAGVSSDQLPAVTPSTSLVSITVGGNDVGFTSVMEACALHGGSACATAVNAGENTARTVLPAQLDTLFASIRAQSPQVKLVVLDYPDFYQLGVWYCVGLSGGSRAKIDEGIDVLDGVLQDAAGRAGASFVDVRGSFVGHQLCSGSKWLHAVDLADIEESYHPTATGQSGGYLPAFSAAA